MKNKSANVFLSTHIELSAKNNKLNQTWIDFFNKTIVTFTQSYASLSNQIKLLSERTRIIESKLNEMQIPFGNISKAYNFIE